MAAAAAISALCEAKAPTLGPHAGPTMQLLVKELPGRIWAGKESLLDAAGALGSFCAASVDTEVCFSVLQAAQQASVQLLGALTQSGLQSCTCLNGMIGPCAGGWQQHVLQAARSSV